MVYPVAEALSERHIPFLFLSGYGEEAIPPGHDDWRVCAKPFKGNDLVKMMSEASPGRDAFMIARADRQSPPRLSFLSRQPAEHHGEILAAVAAIDDLLVE